MKRINKRKIRPPVRKRRIAYTGDRTKDPEVVDLPERPSERLPWFVKKLENEGKTDRVRVHALRRQVKANGRLKMVKVWLVKDKDRNGRWIIRLEGGITGRENLRARRHCGDCFFQLRLRGWTVHEGRLSEDPKDDFFWVGGREIADALQDFGWM